MKSAWTFVLALAIVFAGTIGLADVSSAEPEPPTAKQAADGEPLQEEDIKRVLTDQLKADGWTVKTLDGKLSAHFEHTVAVTANGCVILTQP